MRHLLNALSIAACAAFALPALADGHAIKGGEATIIDLNGDAIGSMILRETPSGQVLVTISATGLSQGWHGVHIHETGACDPATSFKSAGGHLSGSASHGVLSVNGPHPGDLPNQMVQSGGQLVAEIYAPTSLSLSADGDGAVFDTDGSAIIIHSGRDDYESQPAGAAGDRVACGVIEKR